MDSGKGTREVRRCVVCGDPLSNDSEACIDLISWTHFFLIWDIFCDSKTRKLLSDRRDLVCTYLLHPADLFAKYIDIVILSSL